MARKLTSDQQRLVVNHLKIARDHARRWSSDYRRLLSVEDAESIAGLALCYAASIWDPSRGAFWTIAKIALHCHIFKAIYAEMARTETLVYDEDVERCESASPADSDRVELRVIAEWASGTPEREAAIDRAAAGEPLTPRDLALLEELRDELGLLTPETLPVDEAAARAGVSAKTLRKRLAAGSVAGYRSGATWRVYLHGLISATQQPSL